MNELLELLKSRFEPSYRVDEVNENRIRISALDGVCAPADVQAGRKVGWWSIQLPSGGITAGAREDIPALIDAWVEGRIATVLLESEEREPRSLTLPCGAKEDFHHWDARRLFSITDYYNAGDANVTVTIRTYDPARWVDGKLERTGKSKPRFLTDHYDYAAMLRVPAREALDWLTKRFLHNFPDFHEIEELVKDPTAPDCTGSVTLQGSEDWQRFTVRYCPQQRSCYVFSYNGFTVEYDSEPQLLHTALRLMQKALCPVTWSGNSVYGMTFVDTELIPKDDDPDAWKKMIGLLPDLKTIRNILLTKGFSATVFGCRESEYTIHSFVNKDGRLMAEKAQS